MKKARIRKDAFVIGFSLRPDYYGLPPKRYFSLWLGFIEVFIYAGKYKSKLTGGK
jgi:hypothetical protein